jgi:hypothetical protein
LTTEHASFWIIMAPSLAAMVLALAGLVVNVGAYVKAAAAAKLGTENKQAIDVVHKTINSNREKDMVMATAQGHAEGIILERNQADAKNAGGDRLAEVARSIISPAAAEARAVLAEAAREAKHVVDEAARQARAVLEDAAVKATEDRAKPA